jgi:hypothetical protein
MDYTKKDLLSEGDISEVREPAVMYAPAGSAVFGVEGDYDDESLEDRYLLALALERERNDTGVTYTSEEILAKHGLTIADIDAMEDVEIE